MSNHAQSSPFSRLSRLAFPFKSNHSSAHPAEPPAEDWYIPYHGPIQPPTGQEERNTDSWGHLVSGWLMENEDERTERSPRIRALSNASRAAAEDSKRKSTRVQTSFVKLDQAGGVGDTPQPIPVRPRRSQEAPLHHRSSLASILSFGNKKAYRLQHSSSAGDLRKEPIPPVPHETAQDGRPPLAFPRRHPYALATPAVAAPPPPPVSSPVATTAPRKNPSTSRFSVRLLDPLAKKPTAPAYLLPAPRPSRISLKASMSTPNLRQATGTAAVLPKGKQRWLSAETWCDALILPRPRFAMRLYDGESEGGSGRIVSPPDSPLWPPGMNPSLEGADAKVLKKARSAIQLSSKTHQASPPRPPPVQEEVVQDMPVAGPSRLEPEKDDARTHLKPPRPKSFALDDLALPSPVPSLSKVLEDGRQLAEERKAWQREAAKSFGHKRARSVSRARAKSLGSRTPSASHVREPSALDVLAEATLLGSQRRRPTVHVRVRPPRSDSHGTISGFGTTMTGTATGIATWTSASHGQTRSRGHAHSNSVGSVGHSRSDESFMWTPGHGRNQSLGRSALRIVRSTATSAAGFCGIAGAQDEDDATGRSRPAMNDKAAAMEEALRRDGTKVIHLRDQMPNQDDHAVGGLVVITPPLDAPRTQRQLNIGPGGAKGVSPTPSAQSTSVEGMGIAISSPVAPEGTFEKEPIRIPYHPYAQGAAYPYYQRPAGRAPILPALQAVRQDSTGAASPTSTNGEEGVTKHRQPIVVHPYSPYTQIQHPFAAVTGTDHSPKPGVRLGAGKRLEVRPPTARMFAELSPGQIREILPEEIQYSPFIPTPPVQLPEGDRSSNPSGHPYGPSTKRTSEWGFADALNHTMQRPLSTDSGLGTSESHEAPEPRVIEVSHALEDEGDEIVISPEQEFEEQDLNMLSPHSKSGSSAVDAPHRPGMLRQATQASSNHTLASSPMENFDPPVFKKEPSVGERSYNSSASSPGVVSQQSSPPLSPRPITSNDEDLDRFRDLFYRPPESRTPSSDDSRPPVSRRPSSSIHVELNARSTRTLSGLTSLARQLNENMEEMEAYEVMMEGYERDRVSPMWGARHGGMAGQRPSDLGPEPPQVLSQSPPGLVYEREGAGTQLRLPINANLALSQPSDNVPEDVESSRASSMLEMPLDDEPGHLRIGEIEAVSTPSIFASTKRFSTHLSAVSHPEGEISPVSEYHSRRIVSQSSLGVPHSSDAARSSFMTNTSGMSGLSDFPAPPNQITPNHMSILNAYFGEGAHDYRESHYDPARPSLVREASQGTFGPPQMGEAL
ncbi:hypothetical protein BC628DRAFT_511022 [Trametes gibbosa]|nr:hypothetical protein BC628DRAFT_511022 [Trametes gibbosa]